MDSQECAHAQFDETCKHTMLVIHMDQATGETSPTIAYAVMQRRDGTIIRHGSKKLEYFIHEVYKVPAIGNGCLACINKVGTPQ